jgi:membrane protease YdiL (CAAX protease family)
MTPMDARAPAFGHPEPWGYLATVGWTLLAFLVSAGAAYVCFVIWYEGDIQRAIQGPYDGVLVAISALASMPVQVAVLAAAIKFKSWPIGKYLGLLLPTRRDAIVSVVMLIVLLVAVEGTLLLLGQELIPEFQRDAYRTAKAAGWLPALFLAVVVFAPVSEEIVFRGFLYRGFVRRPGHEPYAIVVLTICFMLLHVQYDWIGLLQVFIMGLFLGWVRWSTGSTSLCILLHVLVNFEAMVETAIRVEWQQP